MKRMRSQGGFSLVELLAVVLILAVLAAVAIPLYINTRRSSAARACKANLAAIAAAESAFALRNGAYNANPMNLATATPAGLVGAPEGLSAAVTCPLGDADNNGTPDPYTVTLNADGSLTISCGNAAAHAVTVPPQTDYTRNMAAPASENIP